MSKSTFKTIKAVQFFKDINCTIPNSITKHDLRVFPNYKGQVVNPFGGVFSMAMLSGKNNINKVVTTHGGGVSKYYYSLIVEEVKTYFQLLNTNLYDIDTIIDGVEYDEIKFIE